MKETNWSIKAIFAMVTIQLALMSYFMISVIEPVRTAARTQITVTNNILVKLELYQERNNQMFALFNNRIMALESHTGISYLPMPNKVTEARKNNRK